MKIVIAVCTLYRPNQLVSATHSRYVGVRYTRTRKNESPRPADMPTRSDSRAHIIVQAFRSKLIGHHWIERKLNCSLKYIN